MSVFLISQMYESATSFWSILLYDNVSYNMFAQIHPFPNP